MSGGYFDYEESRLLSIIEILEELLERDFKSTYEWSWGEVEITDMLDGLSPEDREKLVGIFKKVVEDARITYNQLHKIDYFLSGDTGIKDLKHSLNEKR